MRLSIKALAIAAGTIWGGAMLLVGLANMIWPDYGRGFLELVSSLYPGYEPGGFFQVINGTLYGFVDAAIGGAIFAWIYNCFAD